MPEGAMLKDQVCRKFLIHDVMCY